MSDIQRTHHHVDEDVPETNTDTERDEVSHAKDLRPETNPEEMSLPDSSRESVVKLP